MHPSVMMVVEAGRHLSPALTSTTMADKLITVVSQHQALFDKRDANELNTILKTTCGRSVKPIS